MKIKKKEYNKRINDAFDAGMKIGLNIRRIPDEELRQRIGDMAQGMVDYVRELTEDIKEETED